MDENLAIYSYVDWHSIGGTPLSVFVIVNIIHLIFLLLDYKIGFKVKRPVKRCRGDLVMDAVDCGLSEGGLGVYLVVGFIRRFRGVLENKFS